MNLTKEQLATLQKLQQDDPELEIRTEGDTLRVRNQIDLNGRWHYIWPNGEVDEEPWKKRAAKEQLDTPEIREHLRNSIEELKSVPSLKEGWWMHLWKKLYDEQYPY